MGAVMSDMLFWVREVSYGPRRRTGGALHAWLRNRTHQGAAAAPGTSCLQCCPSFVVVRHGTARCEQVLTLSVPSFSFATLQTACHEALCIINALTLTLRSNKLSNIAMDGLVVLPNADKRCSLCISSFC